MGGFWNEAGGCEVLGVEIGLLGGNNMIMGGGTGLLEVL